MRKKNITILLVVLKI